MLKYHPHKSDNQVKNIILLLMIIEKFILVRLPPPILHIIKMSSANKGILVDTKIMKIGQNLEKIPPAFGLVGSFGINLQ